MNTTELEILESVDSIDKVTLEAELSVLKAMGDAYVKQLTLLEYCEDETVLEQYDIFAEADEEKQTRAEKNPVQANGFWRENDNNLLKKILVFIPRLFEAIGRAIAAAFKGDKEVKNLEEAKEIQEAIVSEPEIKEVTEKAEEAGLDKFGDIAGATWKAVLGAIGGVLGINLLGVLSDKFAAMKDFANKECTLLIQNATGRVHCKYDIDLVIEDLKAIIDAEDAMLKIDFKNLENFKFGDLGHIGIGFTANNEADLEKRYKGKHKKFPKKEDFTEKIKTIKELNKTAGKKAQEVSKKFNELNKTNVKKNPDKLFSGKKEIGQLSNAKEFKALVELSQRIQTSTIFYGKMYDNLNDQMHMNIYVIWEALKAKFNIKKDWKNLKKSGKKIIDAGKDVADAVGGVKSALSDAAKGVEKAFS